MIPYNDPDDLIVATHRDLLITDGTVTVSGTNYSVTGATVTITNPYIDEETFELHQSLCSETQLKYGSCETSSVSFVMHDNVPTLKGKTIKVYMIPNSDASKMLQIGVYKVDEDELSADRTRRTITAYDAMYDILNADLAAWYNSLLPNSSSSCTLGQFRFALFSYLNIPYETVTLANDGITIKRTIEPETLSGADVIKAICEINGVFGTINHEGKFRFVELSEDLDAGLFPSETLYPDNALYPQDVNQSVEVLHHSYYTDVQFKDYMSEAITQLTIRTNDEDVGVTVGTSGNTYVITGNFLVYGYNATTLTSVANACLAKIKGRYYKPCTVNCVGNPLLEVGDGIRIHTTYRGIVTYILERRLSGIQALRDTYTSQGEQYNGEQLNSVASQFKQLANKTMNLKADVDGLDLYVTEQLDSTVVGSYANITANQISLKVSKTNIVTDLDDEMSGIDIASNRIDIKSTGVFTVDSSNFRLADTGALTVRKITFDHTGQGNTDMVIDNGTLTAGSTTLNHSGLVVDSGSNTTTVDPGQITFLANSGSAALSCNSSNKLTVNGDAVLTEGASVTFSSDVTVGNIFGACTYITTSSVMVGGYQAGATTIATTTGIVTPAITTDSFTLGIRTGQWQQLTISGTTYYVMIGT